MDNTGKSLWQRIRGKLARMAHQRQLLQSIRHLHGPTGAYAGPDDVTVVVVVKNGLFYLEEFFRHYGELGIRHYVFLDNGSTDGTIDRIRQEPGTVILQSTLPTAKFENDFRRYAAERYCQNRWCLYADIDELFEFEGQQDIGLAGLLRYMRENGYTALMAQMLDLFSTRSLRDEATTPFDQVIKTHQHYDLEKIERVPYHKGNHPLTQGLDYYLQHNQVPNEQLEFLFGGIRNKVFSEQCCLTKHPLVFLDGQVEPGVHPHFSAHLRVADFSALLRHYKFCDNPIQRDMDSVTGGVLSHGEDKLRMSMVQQNANLSLYTPQSLTFTGIQALYDQGFLINSPRYSAFVAQQSKQA